MLLAEVELDFELSVEDFPADLSVGLSDFVSLVLSFDVVPPSFLDRT